MPAPPGPYPAVPPAVPPAYPPAYPPTDAVLPPPPPSDRRPAPPRPPIIRAGARLGVVVATGVLLDLSLQSRMDGVALTLAVVVVAAGLCLTGAVNGRTRQILVVAAVVPALFLAGRASPWLLAVDVLAVGLLLTLGTGLRERADLFDLRFTDLAWRGLDAIAGACLSPVEVGETVRAAASARIPAGADGDEPGESGRPVSVGAALRGLVLAVPVVVILVMALGSADAVFASLIHVDVDLGAVPVHAVAVVAGMWVCGALYAIARRHPAGDAPRSVFHLGALEATIVVGALVAVDALFAVTRLAVALGGHEYVATTTQLTYADYARSGFFQLLWAAAFTVFVLLAVRATVELPSVRARRVFTGLAVAATALTLVIVQTALVRLGLYEETFGLTMLRLASTVFAWWIGAVLVLVGLALAGVGAGRRWLAGAVLCSALAMLVGVNLVGPEQVVARRNLARLEAGERFDPEYVASLSDDAAPILLGALDRLEPTDRQVIEWGMCRDEAPGQPVPWNLARAQAAAARAEHCDRP